MFLRMSFHSGRYRDHVAVSGAASITVAAFMSRVFSQIYFRRCTGDVLEMYWRCTGDVLFDILEDCDSRFCGC